MQTEDIFPLTGQETSPSVEISELLALWGGFSGAARAVPAP